MFGTQAAGRNLQGGQYGKADLRDSDLTGANLAGAVGTNYDASGRLTLDRSSVLPRLDILA